MNFLKHILGYARIKLNLDVIRHGQLNIPVIRSNEGLNTVEQYLESGTEQINYLIERELLNENTEILDFGCGQGRLVNALVLNNAPFKSYWGIDTRSLAIDWCRHNVMYDERIRFKHVPAYNARYNTGASTGRPIPFQDQSFSLIFANSVFSHMVPDDITFYLSEFRRLLTHDGRAYATAFIEDEVPDWEENPSDYIAESTGPLHRVRYNKQYFKKLVEKSDLILEKFDYRQISRTRQSTVLLAGS